MSPSPRYLPFLALTLAVRAAAAPPELQWFTIETPHFRVHYHQGPHQHALAQRVARTCEDAHRQLVPLMGWEPQRKTEVVLTDDVDSANGSATGFLRPVITALAEVPDDMSVLNDYDDYLWGLLVHEYAHVLHLDNARGLLELGNRIFGKVFTPNALSPRWLVEGLATYQESNLSSAGRNRSAMMDMWLRAAFASGKEVPIDVLSNPTAVWPRGNLAYLYGGRFIRYVAERVGEERLNRYFNNYGARVVPFALNTTADEELGVDFEQLYREWQVALGANYRRQLEAVRAAGQSKPVLLTSAGEGTGQPAISPDGTRIYYVEGSPRRSAAIRSVRVDGSDDRHHVELVAGGDIDPAPDGRTVVFSAPQVFREFNYFDDLYLANLESGHITRLTFGLRATEPTYSPDGKLIGFVGRGGSGTTYLGLLHVATGQVERLFEASADERVFTPEFSADGKTIIFSQQHGASRYIREIELESGVRRTLIDGPWLNLHPNPLPDGRILFSSDRTGIYNIFAWHPEDGRISQLTNVDSGAFQPRATPDGRQLVFSYYSPRGWDIARLAWADTFQGQLDYRAARPPFRRSDDPRLVYPVRRYSTWESLLPNYWMPVLAADLRGAAIGVATSGADLTGRHRYSLGASWGLLSREPSFAVGYSPRVAYPAMDFGVSTLVSQSPGFPNGVADRQWIASTTVTFPFSQVTQSTAITVGYEWRAYFPQATATLRPDDIQPLLPRKGTLGSLSLSWSFTNVRRYAASISPEEGHAVAFSVRHSGPETLGTFRFTSAEARYQTYFPLRWAPLHVAAFRVAGGLSVGDVGLRQVFALGGISINDPVLQLVQGQRIGAGVLRGYPPGVMAGNSYALGTVEYRFPIQALERGLSTLPFYVRRIHGAALADVGTVGNSQLEFVAPRGALGVELRAELFFGYYLGTELRLGYARGLGPGGIHNPYLTIGSSF